MTSTTAETLVCAYCGETHDASEGASVEDSPYCASCALAHASQCPRCGELYLDEAGVPVSDEMQDWCDTCASTHAIECAECFALIRLEAVVEKGWSGKQYCPDCGADACGTCGEPNDHHDRDCPIGRREREEAEQYRSSMRDWTQR